MKEPGASLANLSRCLLLLLILSASAGFVQGQADSSLIGTWQSQEANATITLVLNADGSGKLDEANIKYTVNGDKLRVNDSGTINNYTFSLRGNTLTVSGGDLDKPLVFARQGTGRGLGARRNQVAEAAPDSGPVGIWQSRGAQPLRLELNADGTGALNDSAFKWTFDNGVLSFVAGTTTLRYEATVGANTLTITGSNPPKTTNFERVEGSGDGAAREPRQPRSGGGLTGQWQSQQYSVQINENGTLTINGEPFRYSVRGNIMTLSNNEGSAQIPFQLAGDTLTTTFNGQRTVYQRGSASSGPATGGGGNVAAELTGKWCYMSNVNANNGGRMSNRCITLYPNGTFEYYAETSSSGQYGSTASQDSDSGTWRATATTITANSRKHGVLTYSLQKRNHPKTGDAMIVLDGEAFVTATQRPSW